MVPVHHAGRLPATTRWLRDGDGHVSVLDAYGDALDRLTEAAASRA
ncbi:hypothetical protein [Cryptosporangium japonicum]